MAAPAKFSFGSVGSSRSLVSIVLLIVWPSMAWGFWEDIAQRPACDRVMASHVSDGEELQYLAIQAALVGENGRDVFEITELNNLKIKRVRASMFESTNADFKAWSQSFLDHARAGDRIFAVRGRMVGVRVEDSGYHAYVFAAGSAAYFQTKLGFDIRFVHSSILHHKLASLMPDLFNDQALVAFLVEAGGRWSSDTARIVYKRSLDVFDTIEAPASSHALTIEFDFVDGSFGFALDSETFARSQRIAIALEREELKLSPELKRFFEINAEKRYYHTTNKTRFLRVLRELIAVLDRLRIS